MAVLAAVAGVLTDGCRGWPWHLVRAEDGLSTQSVLGVVLLLAGLGLLGFAALVAWRAWFGWRRLWLVPTTVLSLLVIWSVALAVMHTNVPRTTLESVTPADRGLAYTDVTFTTADRVRLSAWLVPAHNRAAVVLLHGAGENRTATLPQAEVLARHGFGLLMVDARGQGRSGGHGMDMGWYGEADVTAAVSFLQHQPEVDPARIAVLGLSMGGEEAIGAAAADPAIRAVVAEGATLRTAADKAGWLPGGVTGAVQRGIDWLTFGVTDLLTSAPRPTPLHTAIGKAQQASFLLIAAGTVKDETRRRDTSRPLRRRASKSGLSRTDPHPRIRCSTAAVGEPGNELPEPALNVPAR